MGKEDVIRIVGIKDGEKVRNKTFYSIERGKTYVDGFALDELQISSVLTSREDIEELINLLQIARFVFPIK